MDADHPSLEDVGPVGDGGGRPDLLHLHPGPRLRLPQVLAEVEVAVGEDPEAVLGPLPRVVEVEEDGAAGLAQQGIVPLGVLGHLDKNKALVPVVANLFIVRLVKIHIENKQTLSRCVRIIRFSKNLIFARQVQL